MKRCVPVLALLVLVLPASNAFGVINAGCDFWFTPSGGAKLVNLTIPAGTLCNDVDLTPGQIDMEHHPIETSQGPSNFDTVVFRPNTVTVGIGQQVHTTLLIVALSLQSVDYLTVSCPDGVDRNYRVYVYLDDPQQEGLIWIRRDSANDGHYDAQFDVLATIKFEEMASGTIHGPISDDVQVISTNNAWWAVQQGSLGTHPGTGITIDTDWDMIPDFTCPGNPNFFPGWQWNNGPKPKPVSHNGGPHPTVCGATNCPPPWTPPQPCDVDAFEALEKNVIAGVGFNLDAAARDLDSTRKSDVTATNSEATAKAANVASFELAFAAVQRCAKDVAIANELVLGIR